MSPHQNPRKNWLLAALADAEWERLAPYLQPVSLPLGQVLYDPGGKLQTVIRKIRRHLFVFVQNRDLTATNNGAERALRPCAVYRKITNGFRSEWGAQLYADIRSVVETGRRRSIRAIDAIRLTLDERPLPIGT